jgi:hypothetical protein
VPVRLALAFVAFAVLTAGVVTTAVRASSHHTPRSQAAVTIPRPVPTASTVSGDADVSGQVQPPAPGTYRYRPVEPGRTEWGEGITAASSPTGTTVQQVVTTTGIHQTLQYTAAAVFELALSQTGTSVAGEVRCTEQPPGVLLQLPLVDAAIWSTTTACTNLLGGQVALQRTSRVMGRTTQLVAGAGLPVWEVVTIIRQRSDQSTSTTTVTQDISARYGLVVRQVTQDGTDPRTIRTDRLVSIQP